MKLNLLYIILFAFFTFTGQVNAQKFGHVNTTELLLGIPEVATADKELEAYQKGLITAREELVKTFQANYQKYVTDVNEGSLSAVQMASREQALQTENANIQNYEVQMGQLLAKKKEELYSPILDTVRKAIEEVGKENGFTMIFDTSTGFLLHAVDTEDVMPLVKAKLGI